MPDAMDHVQANVEQMTQSALEKHTRRTAVRPGLTACERHDCGEPIEPPRTARGARLCLECQEEQDKRDAHFAVWARGR